MNDEIRDREVKALRDYIDSLHGIIDTLRDMIADHEAVEDEEEEEEFSESLKKGKK